ncbi:hypothetical protein MASR2M29_04760 [Spirochaetota bacterium]
MNQDSKNKSRLDNWERITGQLDMVSHAASEDEALDLLIELLLNLRLLGQDESIVDARTRSGDIEKTHSNLEKATRNALDSIKNPSPRFIYFAREVVKKLPVRGDSEDMIEQIRMLAEAFEEERSEDDPLRGFAGDLRKEVHRRLSPRIMGAYLKPYLALVNGNPGPVMKAGYVALPSRFDIDDEDPAFIDLANELLERLSYLWDYQVGDLAAIKESLKQNIPLFERCFLRAEIEGFLQRLDPERLKESHVILEMLKRLTSFKQGLKQSYDEGRIGLYELILVDLSFGRLIFLLANDLTNNHYADISPKKFRSALLVLRELLNISTIKGLAIGDVERRQIELDELRESSSYDYIKAKRSIASISGQLQHFLQNDLIDKMGPYLNLVLDAYDVPTSRLSPIKTRFFNNFIRRTQIHVLSEFVEKIASAIDTELEQRNASMHLYSDYRPGPEHLSMGKNACSASTWAGASELARPFLGGKGNGLIDMASMGLNVPEAFVLGYPLFEDVEALAYSCKKENGGLSEGLTKLIKDLLLELENHCGKQLGDSTNPLLVSVRSGAPISMPGVMVTILNVGLVPGTIKALARRHGKAFTDVLYRRFLENTANAIGAWRNDSGSFGQRLEKAMDSEKNHLLETYLSDILGPDFFTDPMDQLLRCINLVYGSRVSSAVDDFAKTLATSIGSETAVTVQRMVFGNLDMDSLSAVVITRDPITGADELFGEFKQLAQGEEIVMGSSLTEPIGKLPPETKQELEVLKARLIARYRQDLDLEFTVESGRLFLLQTRAARLGAFAQLMADTDYLERGIINADEYRSRLDRIESSNAHIALPRADFKVRRWNPPLCIGVPINGGVVSGTLVLTEKRLEEAEKKRESVIFFAHTTKPTDFAIMNGSSAIVTIYPGRTSHAAITAMSINKPCIVGCSDAEIDMETKRVIFRAAGNQSVAEGERVTVDGNTGAVYRGIAPISEFYIPVKSLVEAAKSESTSEIVKKVRFLINEQLAGLSKETGIKRLGIENADFLDNRRVLVRVDGNVFITDGQVADRESVLRIIPSLEKLLEKGATPVVCSHLGDPGLYKGHEHSRESLYAAYSLKPVAEVLKSVLGDKLVFHPLSVATSGLLVRPENMVKGAINVIENLRFATGEKDNDEGFARSLAELGDGLYVNDAFNVSDRRHASIVGAPRYCEKRLAGLMVERELKVLDYLLEKAARPFVAVFRGTEAAAKFGVMAAILPRVDLLATAEGKTQPEPGSQAYALIKTYPQLLAAELPPALLAEAINDVGTILWIGPLNPYGAADIETMLRSAAANGTKVVICHDSYRYKVPDEVTGIHYSSGPRAFLEYLERLSLPGITILDQPEN